jgi:hypothetical protein
MTLIYSGLSIGPVGPSLQIRFRSFNTYVASYFSPIWIFPVGNDTAVFNEPFLSIILLVNT